ncbi:hypothetical protein PgNI_10104 [Pyricularia grisea]|uniref:Uncharacterized protein n=1 Tax=Pyricularia grisea TaxID=148305 RepID=A0A6P8AYH9_PYRGI|nr:hypothetical protein PgNI_10104 [Pyricularia grisea]TLD07392.1 hypothetical protein PgNI_10104 [Pyricularia grisea]
MTSDLHRPFLLVKGCRAQGITSGMILLRRQDTTSIWGLNLKSGSPGLRTAWEGGGSNSHGNQGQEVKKL